jgi:hypothetical protein
LASVLDYAAASKYRIGTNPARWGGNLEHLLAAPEKIRSIRHHPAMPCAEIGGFITELRKGRYTLSFRSSPPPAAMKSTKRIGAKSISNKRCGRSRLNV